VNPAELTPLTLRDEQAQLEATFLPGAGMLCSSLRHRGVELLAQNRGVEAYVERGKTMGIPLLYPWANRLAAFDFTVAGRVVAVPHDTARVALDNRGLPIHGVIGGRMAWEPTTVPGRDEQAPAGAPDGGESQVPIAAPVGPDARSLAALLSWSEARGELFEVFPFRHDLRYEASLDDGRLEIAVTVHACGQDTVPVAFGFHPYFSLPGSPRERWRVELPAMRTLVLDDHQIPTGPGEELPSQAFELAEREFDDGFDAVPAHARFAVEAGDRRLELELVEGYPCAQVYAPRPGEFICFEPMTAPANALRSGNHLRLLAPGESCRARFAVSCVAVG
jgi:galactose mutarotase-like enzyme